MENNMITVEEWKIAAKRMAIINYSPKYPNKPVYLVRYSSPNKYSKPKHLGVHNLYFAQKISHLLGQYNVFTDELQNRNMLIKRFKTRITIPAKRSVPVQEYCSDYILKNDTSYDTRTPEEKTNEVTGYNIDDEKSGRLTPIYYIACGPEPNFHGSVFKNYEDALKTAERFSEKHKKPIVIYKAFQRIEVIGTKVTDYE